MGMLLLVYGLFVAAVLGLLVVLKGKARRSISFSLALALPVAYFMPDILHDSTGLTIRDLDALRIWSYPLVAAFLFILDRGFVLIASLMERRS